MAVPFRRTSITKKRMRRTHLKKTVNATTTCKNCGATIQPHRACSKCGFYKGQDVLNNTALETEVAPKKENKKVAKTKESGKKETKKTKETEK